MKTGRRMFQFPNRFTFTFIKAKKSVWCPPKNRAINLENVDAHLRWQLSDDHNWIETAKNKIQINLTKKKNGSVW